MIKVTTKILATTLLVFSILSAAPLDTSFTYQGSLSESGALATGIYDFEFQLWSAPIGGSQVSTTVSATAVSVENGIFSAALDFGASPFVGDDLWLLIRVRNNAVGGGLTELLPRQALTPAPFALHAEFVPAGSISNLEIDAGTVQARINGACTLGNAIRSVDSSGNVVCQLAAGITGVVAGTGLTGGGTTASVTIDAENSQALWNANRLQGFNVSPTSPSSNEVLKWSGSNWVPGADNGVNYTMGNGLSLAGSTINSAWTYLGGVGQNLRSNNTGFIGIGTTGPQAKLHINSATGDDALRVQVSGATKLMVHDNGGVGLGYGTSMPSTNGLLVSGNTGIGTTIAATKLHVAGGTDVSVSGGGFLTLGNVTGANIAIDNNEIMARNNGATSVLYFNAEGGAVSLRTTGTGNITHDINITGTQKLYLGGTEDFVFDLSTSGTDPRLVPTASEYGLIGANGREMFNIRSKRFYAQSSLNYLAYSDQRIKEDIRAIPSPLETILRLRGTAYAVKKEHFNKSARSQKAEFFRTNQLGFIAQEIEKVLPQLVQVDDETGLKTVGYMGVIPVLVEAMKVQQLIIESQAEILESLRDRIEALESR